MPWLTIILHLFVGTTLAGSAIVALLVVGSGTMTSILATAIAGYIVAIPVSVVIARALKNA